MLFSRSSRIATKGSLYIVCPTSKSNRRPRSNSNLSGIGGTPSSRTSDSTLFQGKLSPAASGSCWLCPIQRDPDAEGYSFPWNRVEADVRLEGVPPIPLKFELDRGRLLDLLVGHTIYNDPLVAIRELLQNSIDAVRYQRHLDARQASQEGKPVPPMGKVTIRWNSSERLLGSERESDETATFTQLSSPAEPRGTRRWSPPSAWPSTADTAGSYSPGRG